MPETELSHRLELTHAIMHLLETWGLTDREQVRALGMPDGTRPRALRRYREDTPFPDDTRVAEHLEHLVAIAEALRTTYPLNPSMAAIWMRQPQRRFNDRTPAAVLSEDGLSGLVAVRAHLDCTYHWQD